jgi:hypothetical protein
MKKLLLILLIFMYVVAAKAQDKIVTIQKDTIECRIISVGSELIIYEQMVSDNYVTGKSIPTAEVLQYFRSDQQSLQYNGIRRKPKRQKPEHRYLFTLQPGLAHSFSDFNNSFSGSVSSPSDIDSYIDKLKNGYQVSAEIHYLLATFIGIGADYSFFYAVSEGRFLSRSYESGQFPLFVNVELKEKIFTHFAGPSVLFMQFPSRKGKLKITETLSPGIVFFRSESRGNEYKIYWGANDHYENEAPQYYGIANSLVSSTTFGVKADLTFEYQIMPHLSAGLAASFLYAELYKVSLKSLNYKREDQELGKAFDVSHFDFGFTVRYSF